jgi:hypothetical protein
MRISTEKLAYWYFRLNGFLGNNNFIIHKKLGQPEHATEVDYLGVRFVHRKELYDHRSKDWMKDDCESELFKNFNPNKRRAYICLAEVKEGKARINRSQAKDPEVLRQLFLSLGCIAGRNISGIVRRLQKYGFCNTYLYHISFVAIEGNSVTGEYHKFPKIPVITRDGMLQFIYDRFKNYDIEKTCTSEWRDFEEIIEIKTLADQSSSLENFKAQIELP